MKKWKSKQVIKYLDLIKSLRIPLPSQISKAIDSDKVYNRKKRKMEMKKILDDM